MSVFNAMAARAIPWIPRTLVRKISRRYIAGATLDEALERVRFLNANGFSATLDVLGEAASSFAQARRATDDTLRVLDAVHAGALRSTLSIKPSAFGLLLDVERCQALLEEMLSTAGRLGIAVCFDMEDVTCTQREIDLFLALKAHHPNVELALQAYLLRTPGDLGRVLPFCSRVRICKGIYREAPEHLVEGADRDRVAINTHFLAHIARCFTAGVFVAVATHDAALIAQVIALARKTDTNPAAFEFQMLLGVCEPLRDSLRQQGFAVRIYVPFGADWYGYSVRRLRENPRIAGHVARALLDF
ncbi:proline dehydrogenase family protein [Paracidovorax wautersii]|uniref:L-proline dehydrogenase n=1 Tax=Paracidovorax wautersii TaxID=1177982 RepID=A0A1I1ZEL1_9BURK|nr:proline dehydrogenase family protein [Paracidovorax wautersii]SFE30127.1 L-proline dehydrogenase [Paracidovorax wautersii]